VLESHDADTVFEIAGVARARRSLAGAVPTGVDVVLEGDDDLVTARARTDDGRLLASGVAAYANDWVGFRGIEVDPAERGRGLGLLVMAELLEWGAERGATTAYLQVLGDNTRAFALYDGLGFVPHHRYRYLAAPR
jgi:GNAT superfamily N-acetyltransferase